MTRRTLTSFRHAGRGLRWALTSQPNLRLHLAAAVIVLAAAILVGFTTVELAVVVLCAAVVIAA
jgi:diacylglycerol kinase